MAEEKRGWREVLASAAEGFLRLLFPPRCQACGAFCPEPLCSACLAQIERISLPVCHCCGLPLDPHAQHGNLCPECRRGRWFDLCRAACRYSGPLRLAIHKLKYAGRAQLARPLGEMIVAALRQGPQPGWTADRHYSPPPAPDIGRITAVVPVPLHPRRERERGFNQAELLAQHVAEQLSLPVLPHALRRTKDTASQVGLTLRQRQQNVRGAFEPGERGAIRGQTLLLIDDVCTTGSTLDECAKTLKRAGAEGVYAATVARQTLKLDLAELG